MKLSQLENELGEQKFMEFFRRVAEAGVRDTDALIELLAQFASREIADRFLATSKQ